MPDLYLHGRSVETVFHLLGRDENAITYSLGWTLKQCPTLTALFLRDVLPGSTPGDATIRLQEHSPQQGITDVELEVGRTRVVIEAKRGWVLPSTAQLRQYASKNPDVIVALSECSADYSRPRLASVIDGVTVTHRGWRDVARFVRLAMSRGDRAERRVLDEFHRYLETVMPVQNQESNIVYVVSLSLETPRGWGISSIDIVEKKNVYFHPVGNHWPKEPPNYLGFRHHGVLQAIHHVDEYEVGTDPHAFVSEIPSANWEPHFFYKLGPVIRPAHEVRAGRVFRAQRVYAALDLLLTCKTISKARDETDRRLEKWGD